MVKKGKVLASADDAQIVETIRQSANQIWLAGLGAFAKAQEGGGKVFETLLEEGKAIEDRAEKTAGGALSDVKAKVTQSWDKLEQGFENQVARTLRILSLPSKSDIDALSAHVRELTAVVKKVSALIEHPAETKPKKGSKKG